jgi:two-component system chemotaxis response regulator CheY
MSLNILVVDDSRMMRSVLIRTLQISGLPVGEVHEATNGQEGLDQLAKNWIDLALVDINMPIMDGETMIDHMRANPLTKETPVVVISTESSPERVEMLKKKSAGFVHKPFTPETVRETIERVTGVNHESGE